MNSPTSVSLYSYYYLKYRVFITFHHTLQSFLQAGLEEFIPGITHEKISQ